MIEGLVLLRRTGRRGKGRQENRQCLESMRTGKLLKIVTSFGNPYLIVNGYQLNLHKPTVLTNNNNFRFSTPQVACYSLIIVLIQGGVNYLSCIQHAG